MDDGREYPYEDQSTKESELKNEETRAEKIKSLCKPYVGPRKQLVWGVNTSRWQQEQRTRDSDTRFGDKRSANDPSPLSQNQFRARKEVKNIFDNKKTPNFHFQDVQKNPLSANLLLLQSEVKSIYEAKQSTLWNIVTFSQRTPTTEDRYVGNKKKEAGSKLSGYYENGRQ